MFKRLITLAVKLYLPKFTKQLLPKHWTLVELKMSKGSFVRIKNYLIVTLVRQLLCYCVRLVPFRCGIDIILFKPVSPTKQKIY